MSSLRSNGGSVPIAIAGPEPGSHRTGSFRSPSMSPPSQSPPSASPNSGSFRKPPVSLPGSASHAVHFTDRYNTDFEELEWLGKGGFGEVVKAKNRLDGRVYAVKKIRLSADNASTNQKVLREVTTLSRLSHDHVVRYYQAWIETIELDPEEEKLRRKSSGGESDSTVIKVQTRTARDQSLDELLEKTLTENVLASPNNTFLGGFSPPPFEDGNGLGPPAIVATEGAEDCEDIRLVSVDAMGNSQESIDRPTSMVLFIQMEYCEGTLREAIDNDRLGEPGARWKMFRQMLEGLQYIHAEKVIHRDLSPSNIFFDSHGDVKLGDFGLATSLETLKMDSSAMVLMEGDEPSDMDEVSESISMSGMVGKIMYAPPMRGDHDYIESDKLDIYSLGIVFFELWAKFSTRMERIVVLQKLRESLDPPTEFSKTYPSQTALVKKMLTESEIKRPAAKELLHDDLLPPLMEKDNVNEALRTIKRTISMPGYYNRLFGTILQEGHSSSEGALQQSYKCTSEIQVADRLWSACSSVFRCHDAITLRLPPVLPANLGQDEDIGSSSSTVHILTEGNAAVPMALENDSRLSLARYVASSRITRLRCFDIADEYEKPKEGSFPVRRTTCYFDVIGEDPLRAAVELVAAVDDCFSTMSPLPSHPIFMVSHTSFVPSILKMCGLSGQALRKSNEILKDLGSVTWMNIRRRLLLSNVMSAMQADRVGSFLSADGEPAKILEKLKKALSDASDEDQRCVDDVVKFVNILESVHNVKNIRIEMSSSAHRNYFDGIVFRVFMTGKEQEGLVAFGGNYGSLLGRLGYSRQTAVGATIVFDTIVKIICNHERRKSTAKVDVSDYLAGPSRPVDVAICSEPGWETENFVAKIASRLRKSRFNVAVTGPRKSSMREQLEVASTLKASWTLFVDENYTARGTVVMRKKKENSVSELPFGDAVRRLLESRFDEISSDFVVPVGATSKGKTASAPAIEKGPVFAKPCDAGKRAASTLTRAFKIGTSPAPTRLVRGNSASSSIQTLGNMASGGLLK